MQSKVLTSRLDASVNFVTKGHDDDPGFLEARYVRRAKEYLAVYLSSQTGCRQGCGFCHLTASGQTKLVDASIADYLMQAAAVFKHYDENCPRARGVHYNFMARGEAFANPHFLWHGKELFERLGEEAVRRDLVPRFLVSTIMPKSLKNVSLGKLFPLIPPEIYYSIYSTRDEFRRKWLPGALPHHEALAIIKRYQDDRKVVVKLHWAFIKGENDSEDDVGAICRAIKEFELHTNIAIVRYNPYSLVEGEEPSEEVIQRNAMLIKRELPSSRVKVITRVGRDVYASCGTFVPADFKTV